jgi:uncharacterized protein YeaO (DUF488 family)
MFSLHIKSIYLEPAAEDGFRVLVDRQLPPGLTREAAQVDLWLGEIAPSSRLQRWFRDDREKWDEFVQSYYTELDDNSTAVTRLFQEARGDHITLLFTAKDTRYNTAVALKRYLEGEE